ncbi:CPBP family intramembrane glutamic endopeptidase [Pedobacter sp. SYSU D00535]|uniref:CPBP family intramembrane glutamic endopeptidase n=1 Tax=Pedobacter sp. SYSU D00535 TaxID=2810308 RepID=UPI001A9569F3|nr:CPBP family intramembrane glutamic endopeptidase [Pedobacter sp. SYSU D00535]
MTEYGSEDRHPFTSLLYLLFFCVIGSIAFTFIAVIVCFMIYGDDALTAITGGSTDTSILKIIQAFTSVGTFILPSIFFARHQSSSVKAYLKFNQTVDLKPIILAAAIVFAASPFIEWTIYLNQMMKLPSFLKGIEVWMKAQELKLEGLTKQLLLMKTPTDLLGNLLVIAIIPAIGEELLFRGCLQKILIKWTAHYHVGIWVAAVIFSAIHVQFYGFLPRMVLGALFGYLFFWSKNIWVPIVAHFINNGTAVVGAYIYQQRGESLDLIGKQEDISLASTIFSVILTGILGVVFYRSVNKRKDLSDEY